MTLTIDLFTLNTMHNLIPEYQNRQTASHFCLDEPFAFKSDLTLLPCKNMFNSQQPKRITVRDISKIDT